MAKVTNAIPITKGLLLSLLGALETAAELLMSALLEELEASVEAVLAVVV